MWIKNTQVCRPQRLPEIGPAGDRRIREPAAQRQLLKRRDGAAGVLGPQGEEPRNEGKGEERELLQEKELGFTIYDLRVTSGGGGVIRGVALRIRTVDRGL
jgi:hypothetical protein